MLLTSVKSLRAINSMKSAGVSSFIMFLAHCPGDCPNQLKGIFNHLRYCLEIEVVVVYICF